MKYTIAWEMCIVPQKKKNLEKVFPDVYEYNITHVKIFISQNEISMYYILSNIPFKVELFFWIIRNSSFYTFLHLKSLPFSVNFC